MPAHYFPPYRMKASAAAHYTGMSLSAFLRAVTDGAMPTGKKDVGGTYWFRHDLEAAMTGANTPSHDFKKAI